MTLAHAMNIEILVRLMIEWTSYLRLQLNDKSEMAQIHNVCLEFPYSMLNSDVIQLYSFECNLCNDNVYGK
jgi:hypothetical protein